MSLQVAVLSMHTSPLAQPGTGDGGGMNVYVRELATALARAGVGCEVFTRAESTDGPAIVNVEPVFALVLAWAVLGQTIAPVQIGGALLVVGAVMWLWLRKR